MSTPEKPLTLDDVWQWEDFKVLAYQRLIISDELPNWLVWWTGKSPYGLFDRLWRYRYENPEFEVVLFAQRGKGGFHKVNT